MKIFMREWVEKVLYNPRQDTLECGCSITKGGTLSKWYEDRVEHYGQLCDDHFHQYGAIVVTGIDNGDDYGS